MSNKNVDLTRLLPTLRHKSKFPYEWLITPRRGHGAGGTT